MSDDPEVAATAVKGLNSPWIGQFSADDGGETFFVFVEQSVFCPTPTLSKAIFVWFSLFYVFNLAYEKPVRDICLFFQEFVFGLPDNTAKKNSTYLSVTTDIQSFASC